MGGDLFGAKGVPFIDVDNGGTAIGSAETVANAVDGLKNVDTVISGHVEAYPWDDLVRYADFHRNLETYALAATSAGQSPAEVAAAYSAPPSLTDFSFTEPFATNFIQLLSDEVSAR
jgi:hypothetical protein